MLRSFATRLILALSFLGITLTPLKASAEEVNVYSYRQPELIKPLFDTFTAQTGIKVNTAFINKGLIDRLVAEGSRSPADLVLTTDISRLSGIVAAGVTQPVMSEKLQQAIPANYRDADNHWFGLTTRARIIFASKTRVKPGEITTYEDLASPKWKGRICTRSGLHAYNLALTAAILAHHGEEKTKQWLNGVKDNLARKPQGNDRAQVKAIFAGECDVAIGNTYYMAKMLANEEQQEWANAVSVEFPQFENGGTHMNLSGVTLTKAAPNKKNAILLMEFLASPEAQEIYAQQNGEYPVTPSVPASALVASWGTFTPDDLPLGDISKLRPAALKLVEAVNFDE